MKREEQMKQIRETIEMVKIENDKLRVENKQLRVKLSSLKFNPGIEPKVPSYFHSAIDEFSDYPKEARGDTVKVPSAVATRLPVATRYDILDPQFWYSMALLAGVGAKKYGDFNWHKSRLVGEKSPVNHAFQHLVDYQDGNSYDHTELGGHKKFHLIACAFNCMMEFFYENKNT
jgi:hypothetical protein